jgi:hypothetical protein
MIASGTWYLSLSADFSHNPKRYKDSQRALNDHYSSTAVANDNQYKIRADETPRRRKIPTTSGEAMFIVPPLQGHEIQRPAEVDFRVFILFNPSSLFLRNAHLKKLMETWSSWARPGMITVHLAVPIASVPEVELLWDWKSTRVVLVGVPEQETYPPVKFELGLWKKVDSEMSGTFTPNTIIVKLDMDTAFNPDQLLSVHHMVSTDS